MIWNSRNSTWNFMGKKTFGFGDKIPPAVIEQAGKETIDDYVKKGWILDSKAVAEAKAKAASEVKAEPEPEVEEVKPAPVVTVRDALFAKAEGYGLNPHYRAGIHKLETMIEDYGALQELKKEALTLGIDPSDDVTFEELTVFVNEKKAEDESDSSE